MLKLSDCLCRGDVSQSNAIERATLFDLCMARTQEYVGIMRGNRPGIRLYEYICPTLARSAKLFTDIDPLWIKGDYTDLANRDCRKALVEGVARFIVDVDGVTIDVPMDCIPGQEFDVVRFCAELQNEIGYRSVSINFGDAGMWALAGNYPQPIRIAVGTLGSIMPSHFIQDGINASHTDWRYDFDRVSAHIERRLDMQKELIIGVRDDFRAHEERSALISFALSMRFPEVYIYYQTHPTTMPEGSTPRELFYNECFDLGRS